MAQHPVSGPSDVQIPSTPPDYAHSEPEMDNSKSNHNSSPGPSGSMTPPPSTQIRRFQSLVAGAAERPLEALLSSPTTIRSSASSNLPSAHRIANAEIDELRDMVHELIAALTDARMSAAHFKLQHTLLMMETHEAAQRAEVEQHMVRREVEALQAAEQRHRISASATPRPQPSPQPQVAALTRTCKDLEDERDEIEEQLRRTKQHLDHEKDRTEMLLDENKLLKKRIRENREHFTKLKDQSPMYTTPRHPFTTPRRKSYSRLPDSTPAHDNFAALLYADQMLSQETASVPSTPTKSHTGRIRQGHVRGAHSLSSLQVTPARHRLMSEYQDSQAALSAPGSQLVNESTERDRRDRDSTISVSDVEEEANAPDVGQSQASSLASDMLRRNPASQESMRQSQGVERSSNLLQSKLFGNVSKPSLGKRARKASDEHLDGKKLKFNEGVGLGVGLEQWN